MEYMLRRCYDEKILSSNPTYKDCTKYSQLEDVLTNGVIGR